MLKVHFLNVGHGDCTIIEHPDGRLTMIDINNGSDLDDQSAAEAAGQLRPYDYSFQSAVQLSRSPWRTKRQALAGAGYDVDLTNPVAFLRQRYPGRSVARYVQSHPHMEHLRGLVALRAAGTRIDAMWDTDHAFTPRCQSAADQAEWDEYCALRSGARGVTPIRAYAAGSVLNPFRPADKVLPPGLDGLYVLAPTPALVAAARRSGNVNDFSYVVKLVYQGVRFIFAGDAEHAVWDSIVSRYPAAELECDVLAASHHGRDSGYHQEAVKRMNPQLTVVSVGKKPEQDASNKYRQYSGRVWSTRWKGDITVTVDDGGRATLLSQYNG